MPQIGTFPAQRFMLLSLLRTPAGGRLQPPLKVPFPRPDDWDAFWRDVQKENFELVAKRYGGYGGLNMVKKKAGGLKRLAAKLLKG